MKPYHGVHDGSPHLLLSRFFLSLSSVLLALCIELRISDLRTAPQYGLGLESRLKHKPLLVMTCSCLCMPPCPFLAPGVCLRSRWPVMQILPSSAFCDRNKRNALMMLASLSGLRKAEWRRDESRQRRSHMDVHDTDGCMILMDASVT